MCWCLKCHVVHIYFEFGFGEIMVLEINYAACVRFWLKICFLLMLESWFLVLLHGKTNCHLTFIKKPLRFFEGMTTILSSFFFCLFVNYDHDDVNCGKWDWLLSSYHAKFRFLLSCSAYQMVLTEQQHLLAVFLSSRMFALFNYFSFLSPYVVSISMPS